MKFQEKVVTYARVSSIEQEKGFSIKAQQDLLENYSEKNNFVIAKRFIEAESAKSKGRIEFNNMLNYLETHKEIRTILVEKTDRLYRNYYDCAVLSETDYDIHFVKEHEILNKNSSSHEKFVHGIKVLMSKIFVYNLSTIFLIELAKTQQ